jgi:uroporphyrinogen-III synthase
MNLPLLIFRPEPGASASATNARSMGLEPHCLPLFKVEPRPWSPPKASGFDAVVATSANAMRMGGEGLGHFHHLPLLAVGQATAAAARGAGFAHVVAGSRDVVELSALAQELGHARLLHLAGEEHQALNPPALQTCIVYAAVACDPPPRWPFATGTRCVALVHSPRAARLAGRFIPEPQNVDLVAISQAAADSASGDWRSLAIAPEPHDAAMLEIAQQMCQTHV